MAGHVRRDGSVDRPRHREIWRRWPAASDADVETAVARARVAQPGWAELPLGTRRRALARFRRLLFERRTEMASLIEREAGKPAAEAMMADVIATLDAARFCERRAGHVLTARTMIPSNIAIWRKRPSVGAVRESRARLEVFREHLLAAPSLAS